MAQDKIPDKTVARSVRASGDDPNPRGVYNGRETVNRRDRPDLGMVSEPARAGPIFAETDLLVGCGGPAGVTLGGGRARAGGRGNGG